jgi:hypothetical protein
MNSLNLAALREQLNQLARGRRVEWNVVSSGLAELDAILPAQGFRRGTLVEWQAKQHGLGATSCALRSARAVAIHQQPVVIVDYEGTFYPPGLHDTIDWQQVLLVRCRSRGEALWATDQVLRTPGVGAVLVGFEPADERRIRRWQLAAEQSGALGFLVRKLARQPEACFSELRILVTPLPTVEGRRVRLELLRCRQGRIGKGVEVSLDDDAPALPQARTEVRRRSAGA